MVFNLRADPQHPLVGRFFHVDDAMRIAHRNAGDGHGAAGDFECGIYDRSLRELGGDSRRFQDRFAHIDAHALDNPPVGFHFQGQHARTGLDFQRALLGDAMVESCGCVQACAKSR